MVPGAVHIMKKTFKRSSTNCSTPLHAHSTGGKRIRLDCLGNARLERMTGTMTRLHAHVHTAASQTRACPNDTQNTMVQHFLIAPRSTNSSFLAYLLAAEGYLSFDANHERALLVRLCAQLVLHRCDQLKRMTRGHTIVLRAHDATHQ